MKKKISKRSVKIGIVRKADMSTGPANMEQQPQAAAKYIQYIPTEESPKALYSGFPQFPQRTGAERYLYFDVLCEADITGLTSRGYTPVVIGTMPRETERDHRAYLLALTQGMSDGTLPIDRDRLAAADLDMRAHGMLSRYSTGLTDDNKRRKTLECILTEWAPGRHAVHQSTVTDPAEVERFLRTKAGIAVLQPEEKRRKMKKRWTRKAKGSND